MRGTFLSTYVSDFLIVYALLFSFYTFVNRVISQVVRRDGRLYGQDATAVLVGVKGSRLHRLSPVTEA